MVEATGQEPAPRDTVVHMSDIDASQILENLAEDFEELAATIREDGDISATPLGAFFQDATLDPVTLDAVAAVCATVADSVPRTELLNDAVIALPVYKSDIFLEDDLPLIVGDEDDPELYNEDGSRAEKVFSIPEVTSLLELLNVPVVLTTDEERSYVRSHRLIRAGYYHHTLQGLLSNVIRTSEEAAFEDIVKRIDIDQGNS